MEKIILHFLPVTGSPSQVSPDRYPGLAKNYLQRLISTSMKRFSMPEPMIVSKRDTLKFGFRNAQTSILPKDTKFQVYIGHTLINISNITLTKPQMKALKKGLTFCPTPGPQDRSQIWLNFKEFHRHLQLIELFHRENNQNTDIDLYQSIIDFMNNNAQSKLFNPKSTQRRCKKTRV